MDMPDIDIPIWVINLKRDVARKDFMVEQLERLGLPYELIEAVDGSTLSEEEMSIVSPELSEQRIYRQLTHGEIGCALSHIRLWERMVREDIHEVLIFEDDVLIGRNMVDILLNREKLPQNWEHINFTAWARVVPFGDFIFDIYRIFTGLPNFSNGHFQQLPTYLQNQEQKNYLKRFILSIFRLMIISAYQG